MHTALDAGGAIDWGRSFLLADCLQFIALSRKTGQFEIGRDGDRGEIYAVDGQPVHAVYGDQHGADALFSLLALRNVDSWFNSGAATAHHTIREPLTVLLLDAARTHSSSRTRVSHCNLQMRHRAYFSAR